MFLDVLDLQLLDLLKQNSRAKLKELANDLNLSAATVKYRIDRLVEWGIIENFTIAINRKKAGYEVLAYLIIYATSKIYINTIINHLERFPEICNISVLMGDPDIMAKLNAYSMNNLVDLLKNVSQIEEIQTFKTWFVMDEMNLPKKVISKQKKSNMLPESALKKVRSNI